MKPGSDDISKLRNLGPTSAAWLRAAGINTQSQLRSIGPVVAYQIVRESVSKVSLNLLWAMAAGLADEDWRELSVEQKQCLRKELKRLTQADHD